MVDYDYERKIHNHEIKGRNYETHKRERDTISCLLVKVLNYFVPATSTIHLLW